MEALTPEAKLISDFIYYYPQIAADFLNKRGYSVDKKKATLPELNQKVFNAIYIDQNEDLINDIDSFIQNEGNSNFVTLALAAASLASSIAGTIVGGSEAARQRQLLRDLALADLAQQEKLQFENIRTQAETERIKILTNTLLEYRKALQTESTVRLKDTWIYVAAMGCIMAIFYGLYLVNEKKNK